MSASPTIAALDRIRAYAAAMGWPKSRLAVKAGMPANTLRKFHDADWNPTVETLLKLEALVPEDFRPEQGRKRAKTAEIA